MRAIACVITGSPSSLYEPHKSHNMASNSKGLYGIFYKISMKVVVSDNSHVWLFDLSDLFATYKRLF